MNKKIVVFKPIVLKELDPDFMKRDKSQLINWDDKTSRTLSRKPKSDDDIKS